MEDGFPSGVSAVSERPRFLITIDAEGDSMWARPRMVTTRNAEYLPRFQALAETYGLKPTYLTTYEMAKAPAFQDLGQDILKRGTGEIGMHLHAWNTPPLLPLTSDDYLFQPYLIEYPQSVMHRKIGRLTGMLEETFGVRMLSHRAGRWGFNELYARMLVAMGYRVDCSVTPFVSWRRHAGGRDGGGGTDYRRFPSEAYFVDLDDVSRPGKSSLLEIPVTIVPANTGSLTWLAPIRAVPPAGRVLNRLAPSVYWLRPDGRNLRRMLSIVRQAVHDRKPYLEFMLHSSELMPGGSPRFPGAKNIENLYGDLTVLFAEARRVCVPRTLREYHQEVLDGEHTLAAGRVASCP